VVTGAATTPVLDVLAAVVHSPLLLVTQNRVSLADLKKDFIAAEVLALNYRSPL
jgi:hypothetical protein